MRLRVSYILLDSFDVVGVDPSAVFAVDLDLIPHAGRRVERSGDRVDDFNPATFVEQKSLLFRRQRLRRRRRQLGRLGGYDGVVVACRPVGADQRYRQRPYEYEQHRQSAEEAGLAAPYAV